MGIILGLYSVQCECNKKNIKKKDLQALTCRTTKATLSDIYLIRQPPFGVSLKKCMIPKQTYLLSVGGVTKEEAVVE